MVHDAADVPTGPRDLDSVRVAFDEQRLISDAGLLVTATLAEREQLFHEPAKPALRVRLPLTVTDVQHLAGIRTDRENRVIPKLARVPVAGALLALGADLPNEAVDVDHQRPVARPAPAAHARVSARSSTRSSWRTCPNVNARKNVPSVEGAITLCPTISCVDPARSRFI
jgi:hypothetical protein